MSDRANVVERLHEQAYGEGNLEVVDELLAPDYVEHNPVGVGTVEGRDGYKEVVRLFRTAFPDFSIDIEDTVVDGETVVIRFTGEGTHEGPLLGIEPTGNEVEVTGIDIGRVRDGQLQEAWVQMDNLGLLEQLDVLPEDSDLF